jgi:hypothetical protein
MIQVSFDVYTNTRVAAAAAAAASLFWDHRIGSTSCAPKPGLT